MTVRGQLITLIVVRLVLVTLVSAAAIFSSTFGAPTSEFVGPALLVVYALSGLYLLFWRYSARPTELYYTQFFADLALVSLLLYFSGGITSPFSSFYVLIIVYSSLLRDRKGAILAVSLSILSYVSTANMPYLDGEWPDPMPYSQALYRMLWNIFGFISVGLLGSFLSERTVSARQELGKVKLLHDNIVNSIRTGLVTLDMLGRVTSINRAAEEICRIDGQALLFQPATTIFPGHVLNSIQVSDFQPVSRPLRIDFWHQKNLNAPIFLGMSCSPLMSADRAKIGYVLSFQDLTEIKKREEELQVKEKMAAIGQVAAGLAHEIRNPLGALSGSIQVLQSELQLTPQQARLLGIVLRECNRLNKTVADFLTYAGPPPIRLQPIDLAAVVRETVALCKNSPEFSESHVFELQCDRPLECMADPDQLRQAFWNILQNAWRAMPRGGKVTIAGTQDASMVGLRFSDQGVGMSTEDKKKIFQPFHTAFPRGVGLGLAIVYQIVTQHGGQILIDSKINQGTTVEIRIPAINQHLGIAKDQAPAKDPRTAVAEK